MGSTPNMDTDAPCANSAASTTCIASGTRVLFATPDTGGCCTFHLAWTGVDLSACKRRIIAGLARRLTDTVALVQHKHCHIANARDMCDDAHATKVRDLRVHSRQRIIELNRISGMQFAFRDHRVKTHSTVYTQHSTCTQIGKARDLWSTNSASALLCATKTARTRTAFAEYLARSGFNRKQQTRAE